MSCNQAIWNGAHIFITKQFLNSLCNILIVYCHLLQTDEPPFLSRVSVCMMTPLHVRCALVFQGAELDHVH